MDRRRRLLSSRWRERPGPCRAQGPRRRSRAYAARARADPAVAGDPIVPFAVADRRTRQNALLPLYSVEQSLGVARGALRALAAQSETIKRDVGGSGQAPAIQRADSALARTVQLESTV